MGTQWQRWAALAALATVGLGACGGGDDKKSSAGGKSAEPPAAGVPGGGPGGKIEVGAKEFSFSPNTLTLKAGQPSTIELKNIGSIEHDITVGDAGFKLTVPAGKSGDKELKLDKPGAYEFHCSVEGHKDAGMKGELTVE
jgi:uncharacterized cupredoxin-like copper-binding protein